MANKSIQAITFFSVIALFSLLSCVCADECVINGQVKDSRDNPLEGIIVEIYKTGDKNPVAQTKTDSNGSYSVNIKNGTYEVCVIGGSDSWIYQKTKIDYFGNVYWIPQSLKVTDENPVENAGLTTMSITPWDWIAALIFLVLCFIIVDQIFLRRINIRLVDLINTLLFRLRHTIRLMINRIMPVPEAEIEKQETGTKSGEISKKDKSVIDGVKTAGPKIEAKKEVEGDIRMITFQSFCPITKMKLREIPKDKLYKCPNCGTYYHYDAIAPMKACINCKTPVSPVFPMDT